MNIIYIVGHFPIISETFILNQITRLIERGHLVEILALNDPKEKKLHQDVVRYKLLEKTQYIEKSHSPFGFKINTELIAKLLFADVVHAHFVGKPCDFAMTVSDLFIIPFFVTAHANDIFTNIDPTDLKIKFSKATGILTISDFNKQYLSELLYKDIKKEIEIVRCGIDLNKFQLHQRPKRSKIKILFVGRLEKKKGIIDAVKAIKLVLNRYSNIEFRIVGEGNLKDDLIDTIKELEIDRNTILLGAKTQEEVIKELKEADIFFLPSTTTEDGDREGIPVSIMEAQATGLPVVSTQHSGIPELIDDKDNGLLVRERDVEGMANALLTLINDHKLRYRMGKAGRERINIKFNLDQEIEKLENIFVERLSSQQSLSTITETHKNKLIFRLNKFGQLVEKLNEDIDQKEITINELRSFVESVKRHWSYKVYTVLKPILKRN